VGSRDKWAFVRGESGPVIPTGGTPRCAISQRTDLHGAPSLPLPTSPLTSSALLRLPKPADGESHIFLHDPSLSPPELSKPIIVAFFISVYRKYQATNTLQFWGLQIALDGRVDARRKVLDILSVQAGHRDASVGGHVNVGFLGQRTRLGLGQTGEATRRGVSDQARGASIEMRPSVQQGPEDQSGSSRAGKMASRLALA
jgi:hypothetical protein